MLGILTRKRKQELGLQPICDKRLLDDGCDLRQDDFARAYSGFLEEVDTFHRVWRSGNTFTMPKKKSKVSAGTARRLVAKTVEDKTFGMKNKKGAKARKFIQHVEQQAKAKFMNQGRHRGMVNEQQQQAEKKKRKEAIKKEAVLMAQMLGISVEDATAAFTGKKVKKKKSKTKDKSEEVEIGPDGKKKKKKAGVSESSAIQKAQARRRALRRQRKRAAGEEYEIDESLYEEDTPIEEIIEEERKALIESGVKLTPITFENFQEWKKRKKLKKDTEVR
mgnify:FL=1